MTEYNQEFLRVDTSDFYKYSSFTNGSIKFKVGKLNKWHKCHKCIIVPRLNIIQTDAAGIQGPLRPIQITAPAANAPGTYSIPYLCNNPIAVLFDKCNLEFNDKSIYDTQYTGLTTTLFRMVNESEEEQKQYSTNSILPLSIEDTYTSFSSTVYAGDKFPNVDTANVATNRRNILASSHNKYALKRMFGFNQYTQGQLCGQLPFPIYMSDVEIPPNMRNITYSFTSNSSYANDLIHFSGGSAGYSVYPMTTAGITTNSSIYVGIDDISIYLYTYDKTEKVPRSLMLSWWGFDGTILSIQNGTTNYKSAFSLKADKIYSKILLCFYQPHSTAGALNYGTSQTEFNAGFAYAANGLTETYVNSNANVGGTTSTNLNNAPFQLNQFTVSFNDLYYPKGKPYTLDLNFQKVTEAITGLPANPYILAQTNDNWRAYNDYIRNCPLSFTDRSSNMMSYNQWIVNPIFIMSAVSNEQGNNTGTIELQFNNPVTNCMLFVMGISGERMNIKYNTYDEPSVEF